jgi:hypothetical protein
MGRENLLFQLGWSSDESHNYNAEVHEEDTQKKKAPSTEDMSEAGSITLSENCVFGAHYIIQDAKAVGEPMHVALIMPKSWSHENGSKSMGTRNLGYDSRQTRR